MGQARRGDVLTTLFIFRICSNHLRFTFVLPTELAEFPYCQGKKLDRRIHSTRVREKKLSKISYIPALYAAYINGT